MHSQVTLTVIDGRLEGKQYVFDRPRNCLIGRAGDCEIRLPDALEYLTVSRHHCLVEAAPPEIRVRDLGSKNGTFVNGLRIGPELGRELAQDDDISFTAFDLRNADTLRVGDTAFWVTVNEPVCGEDGLFMPAAVEASAALAAPCLN
jgi:pSer/pThr/pTyr-binding forkhead associated (FHA) protein